MSEGPDIYHCGDCGEPGCGFGCAPKTEGLRDFIKVLSNISLPGIHPVRGLANQSASIEEFVNRFSAAYSHADITVLARILKNVEQSREDELKSLFEQLSL